MYLRITTDDMASMGPYVLLGFIVLLAILVILIIFINLTKNKDNGKPEQCYQVKVLEKPVIQETVEWIVVETDSGERFKLKNTYANKILISVGDTGTISFKGNSITNFKL